MSDIEETYYRSNGATRDRYERSREWSQTRRFQAEVEARARRTRHRYLFWALIVVLVVLGGVLVAVMHVV